MKVQFADGQLRLRLGHVEFAALRRGEALSALITWPAFEWRIDVLVADGLDIGSRGQTVRIALPRDDVDALAKRLPAKDGLRYAIDLPSGPLELRLEVDLHDGRPRRR